MLFLVIHMDSGKDFMQECGYNNCGCRNAVVCGYKNAVINNTHGQWQSFGQECGCGYTIILL